ncbi:hypothetical protein [Haloferax profundi]|uniref:Uncharacterized protein n=1 Tax=Haloferax profundi TaxID=1544718 RepID=A0A0W1STH0_9EURY|nr:hypothetical protein [Haloferax profundi]KTG29725.1 hypothetical protein AUR66_09370 [Haloferax profundi]
MNRRTYVTSLVTASVSAAGCLRGPGREFDTLLVNRTPGQLRGLFEIATTSGETVATEQFDIGEENLEYTHALTREEAYQFSVTLESGLTETDELAISGGIALQVDLYPDDIQFKTVTVPSP